MIDEPIHVTDAAFEKSVMQSTLPVVVDFWAPWCGPCRMVAPVLDKLAKEYSGKLVIAKVNTDENPQWAQKFNVQGIPTMLFVAKGKIVHQQVGALPEPMLRSTVDQFLNVVSEKES
jgi:thioredoxin 1